MRIKIIKTSALLLTMSFVLSACSLTFPWEKDRVGEEISTTPVNVTTDNDEVQEEKNDENSVKAQGELRKFSDLNSLQNFLTKTKLPSTKLLHLGAENSYGPFSEIEPKNLTTASVNLELPDITKIKGDYAYILSENKLSIVKIKEPLISTPIFELDLEGEPLELAILDNYLAISGYSDKEKHYSFLKIFDIAQASSPRLMRSLLFEGTYTGLRLSNGFAYFLTSNQAELNSAKKILPKVISDGKTLSSTCTLSGECVLSQVYYFNNSYNNYGFLSSLAIKLADAKSPIVRQLFLIDDSYRLYVSASNNVYISKGSSLSQADLERDLKIELVRDSFDKNDKEILLKIETEPSYLQNTLSKEKLDNIIAKYFNNLSAEEQSSYQENIDTNLKAKVKSLSARLDVTSIYKFSWQGDRLSYLAFGMIPGVPLSGLSFSEDGESLYAATSRGDLWSLLFIGAKKNYSNIYVLDSSLKTINALENISTDNLIKQASFMDKRVYLKTALEDNPVYVISLDEIEPLSVLGAISTESYANFYPFSASGDSLLALGKSTGAQTDLENSLKLTVFDFKDLKKPAALSTYAIGDSASDSFAFLDYKGMTNSLAKKIISLPASFKDQNKLSFSGALVFDYNDEGELNMLYRIDHSQGGTFTEELSKRGLDYLKSTVLRSFISGNNLYTLSPKYLKINNLADGNELASVNLSPSPQDKASSLNSDKIDVSLNPGSTGVNDISMSQAALSIDELSNRFFGSGDEVIGISDISEDYGMYQAEVAVGETSFKVFLSKDGTLFFSGLINISDLDAYDNRQEKYKELSLPEAQDVAARYINYLAKKEGKALSVKEVTEQNNLYNIIAGPADGLALSYYMTKDGYIFFSQVALVK